MVVQISVNPAIPALPKMDDKKKVNVRYMLIPPFASAHIHWDEKIHELVYDIEEPILNEHEKAVLAKLEGAMLELININVAVEKTLEATTAYLDKTARLLIDELNIGLAPDSYNRLFYYLYRDFVGLNEIEPMMRDYFIEDVECNGVDSPVYIIHRIYRNLRTNLTYRDVEKLASFVEKLAQRCGRYISYAQPLLDGALPDGSIDYREPVIIRKNGIVKVDTIGGIIDSYYKEGQSDAPVYVDDIEVVSFDKHYKLGWKKADYVYRHKTTEPLFKLNLEFGRHIALTGNHSVFVLRKEGVTAERTDTLLEGDYVVLPSHIPRINNTIKEINLAEALARSSMSKMLLLKDVPHRVYAEKRKEIMEYYAKNYAYGYQAYYANKSKSNLPLALYLLLSEKELRNCFIGTISNHKIPTFLPITKELMQFLGLYVAEGWTYDNHSYGVYFSLNKNESELIEMIQHAARVCFRLNAHAEPPQYNGIKVKVNSMLLWLVMKEVLGVTKGAKQKRVPELIFNVEKELQQEFIHAWHAGDYSTTMSEMLAQDIAYLALFNEDIAAFYKASPKTTFIKGREIHNDGAFYSNFYARDVEHPFPSMIPMELFNPLNTAGHRLQNKRIERARLLQLLNGPRYRRFEDLSTATKKFNLEWSKRGFIEGNSLSGKGKELVRELGVVKKLAVSDFCFARIKSIKRVPSTTPHVYDFSVAGDENFVAGIGGICCHNSRINASYTKDVTSHGPTFTCRKFTKTPWTPTQMIALNTISPEMLAYFWMLLQYRMSVLIAGGTGSGKTTLLNALAFFIPPEARVVSIEDTRELNLPRENWLPAVARPSIGIGKVGEVDLFALLRSSFRQMPDYLIVGEVRGKEAFVLFQGMASGHASLSTMHADSVDTLIRRLQTPPIELSPTLVNTLDCVAVMAHAVVNQHETRRLREVVEIVSVNKDGTALVNTPFVWNPEKDVFFFKKQSKAFEKISARHGVQAESLQKEFAIRTKLLYELYKRKVFDFDEIGKIINEYYKNPVDVLVKYGVRG